MKKRLLMILAVAVLLVGCGNQQETNNPSTDQPTTTESTSTTEPTSTEAPTTTEEPTEPPHEHTYTESITKEATCTEAGEKTFTCECGDTYTEQIEAIGHSYEVVADSAINATCETDGKEADTKCSVCADVVSGAVIPATGHSYVDYVYNNDATYEADGTETATCVCGFTDTRTASGTKLELLAEPNLYGMTFDSGVKWSNVYCMENTDVYFEPSFSAPSIGKLSINDEVGSFKRSSNVDTLYNYPPYDKTESPTELMWAQISYNGQTGYVPYKYLWPHKRDTSIALHPLAANYPTLNGGSGIFAPADDGKLYYVYGASQPCTVKLNPACESLRVYDANLNLIAEITDPNVSFAMTGNAYCSWGAKHYDWRYEINYNGTIAYVNSLDGIYQ